MKAKRKPAARAVKRRTSKTTSRKKAKPKLCTVADGAKIAQRSRTTIGNLIRSGKLKIRGRGPNGGRLVSRVDVEKFADTVKQLAKTHSCKGLAKEFGVAPSVVMTMAREADIDLSDQAKHPHGRFTAADRRRLLTKNRKRETQLSNTKSIKTAAAEAGCSDVGFKQAANRLDLVAIGGRYTDDHIERVKNEIRNADQLAEDEIWIYDAVKSNRYPYFTEKVARRYLPRSESGRKPLPATPEIRKRNARILAQRKKHPEWTRAELARHVGVSVCNVDYALYSSKRVRTQKPCPALKGKCLKVDWRRRMVSNGIAEQAVPSPVAKKVDIAAIDEYEREEAREKADGRQVGHAEAAAISVYSSEAWRVWTIADESPFYLDHNHEPKSMGVVPQNGHRMIPREVAEKVGEVLADIRSNGPIVLRFEVAGVHAAVAIPALRRHLEINHSRLYRLLGWYGMANKSILGRPVRSLSGQATMLYLKGRRSHRATGVTLADAVDLCKSVGKPWPGAVLPATTDGDGTPEGKGEANTEVSCHDAGKETSSETAAARAEIVADPSAENGNKRRVTIEGRKVFVDGKQEKVTISEFEVVKPLVESPVPLSKDDLEWTNSGARKTLRRMMKRRPWSSVIHMAGRRDRGYSIE